MIITSGQADNIPKVTISATPSTSVTSSGKTIIVDGVDSKSFTLQCTYEGAYFEKFVIQYEEAPVTVKVDVGAGHEGLLGGEMLDYIADKMELKSATLDGSIVTLVGVNPEACESDIRYAIWENIFSLTDNKMHNGEMFYDVGYKSFDKYATSQEFDEETYDDEEHDLTPISDGKTYYVLWRKPLGKLELGTGDPVCGKATEDVKPTVPEGVKISFSSWYEGKAYIERFKGGIEYTGFIVPKIDIEGVLWKYFIDPEKTEVSVKGGKKVKKVEGEDFAVSFKATADHDWDAGTETKKATTTSEGVRTFKCKHFDTCGATKTVKTPKIKPNAPTGKVTILNTVANSKKKTNGVKWNKSKVKNATNYEFNWRAKGAKKWASKTVGNTTVATATGLSNKGLYEFRVRPKNGTTAGAWSNTVYRYFHTTEKIRLASKNKGAFTMSWKNNPQATSYQVMFSTNKNGAGAAKNISMVGKGKASFTKKGLKSGRTYYVQAREIRKVGNINYIGNISCPVAVKVK